MVKGGYTRFDQWFKPSIPVKISNQTTHKSTETIHKNTCGSLAATQIHQYNNIS